MNKSIDFFFFFELIFFLLAMVNTDQGIMEMESNLGVNQLNTKRSLFTIWAETF